MEQNTTKDTAKGAFMQAEGYFQAAHVLFTHATQLFCFHPQFLIPSMVLEAFSLELFLKALILIEGSQYPGTHDLEELFNQLGLESKAIIKTRTEQNFSQMQNVVQMMHQRSGEAGPPPQVDFEHASRLAFEAFRYIHEHAKPNDHHNWMGRPILHAVRKRIVDLKPDWKNIKFVSDPAPKPPVP